MGTFAIIAKNPASGGGALALALSFSNSLQPVGIPVSGCALVANGGAGGYVYALFGITLPSWLTFNVSTGVFAGTPPTPNVNYSFTGQVTDSSSAVVSAAYTLTISNQLELRVFGSGTVGSTFGGGLKATGGISPYTYLIATTGLDRKSTRLNS